MHITPKEKEVVLKYFELLAKNKTTADVAIACNISKGRFNEISAELRKKTGTNKTLEAFYKVYGLLSMQKRD